MAEPQHLSEKSVTVLKLIAAGYSHGQIVDKHPDITYLDICRAAQEALLINRSPSSYHDRLEAIKQENPRAYERWSSEEDATLSAMFRSGVPVAEIAAQLRRQPSAIRSRLTKLGLGTVVASEYQAPP